MYFSGEHVFLLEPVGGPIYNRIHISVYFYTYASCHTITGNVTWTDRPYIELVPYGLAELGGGTLTNGASGATRTVSGRNVRYRHPWSTPVVKWKGNYEGTYYDILLTYPRVYHYLTYSDFIPHNWYDGGGVISSEMH